VRALSVWQGLGRRSATAGLEKNGYGAAKVAAHVLLVEGSARPKHPLYVEEFEDAMGGLLGAQGGLGLLGNRSIDGDTDL
jgi:hypothetical protein